MNALGEMLRSGRSLADERIAVGDGTSALNRAELYERASELDARLQRVTRNEGATVAVVLPLSVDAVVALVAAIIGDRSICFVDPALPADRRRDILAMVEPAAVVDANGVNPTLRGVRGAPSPPVAGYVATTSGSTGGAPKGVLCPWETVAAFVPFGAAALELESDATWAELSHPAYDMAMTNLLLALGTCAALRLSATFRDRVRPLRFLKRVEATHVRLAPRFCDMVIAEGQPQPADVLRVWGSGGDRLFSAQARGLFDLGVRTIVNTYGTSETSGFASAARLVSDEPLVTLRGSVSIGRGEVGPWRTRLVGPSTSTGVLAISSPYRPSGYLFGQPTGEHPRWEGSDSLVTGDLGERRGDDLFCLGRAGRRIKRNARFVDLDAVDATIRTACDAMAFTVATADGTLITLVESSEAALDDLRRRLPAVLTPDVLPERLIATRQLPRLGNAKIDHAAALAQAEARLSAGQTLVQLPFR